MSDQAAPSVAKASARGVEVNKARAQSYAETMMRMIANLEACGITTNSGIASELHRLGYKGRRGGRIDRKRIFDIRQRLKSGR